MPHTQVSRNGAAHDRTECPPLAEILHKEELRRQLGLGIEYPSDRLAQSSRLLKLSPAPSHTGSDAFELAHLEQCQQPWAHQQASRAKLRAQ